MEANELRIGNYVYDEGDLKNPIQVVNIQEDNTEWLKPIPLTEQWLLDFGFEKGANDNYNNLAIPQEEIKNAYIFCNHLNSTKYYNSGIAFVKDYCDEVEISLQTDFKYVHELQNLYYALTKKELTLQK